MSANIYKFPSGELIVDGTDGTPEEYSSESYGNMVSEAMVTLAEEGFDPKTAVLVMRDKNGEVCIISSSGEVHNDSIISTLQRAVTKASTTSGYVYEDDEE